MQKSKLLNKKILVVGGAGYIGSHVNRALLDRGFKTTVFDNLSTGSKVNLMSESEFIHGDLLDYEEITKALSEDFDAIIHLAAFKAAGESMLAPEKYARNNLIGTINLLNAASAAGIKKIIFLCVAVHCIGDNFFIFYY